MSCTSLAAEKLPGPLTSPDVPHVTRWEGIAGCPHALHGVMGDSMKLHLVHNPNRGGAEVRVHKAARS